jgi:hypothetical protein
VTERDDPRNPADARREETGEKRPGLADKMLDMAREKGWVDENQAKKAHEKGLVDKANQAIDRLRGRFGV